MILHAVKNVYSIEINQKIETIRVTTISDIL